MCGNGKHISSIISELSCIIAPAKHDVINITIDSIIYIYSLF
jgi:hypothetical protein